MDDTSEQIKYFDWPWPEWRLDKDEEEQLSADVDEAINLRDYLERRKTIGTQGSAVKKSESWNLIRRRGIRKRQSSS